MTRATRIAIRPFWLSDVLSNADCRSSAPAKTRAGETGFSLIELLVSLVLLALLMVLIPGTLTMARREARVAVELDRRARFDAALTFVEHRLAEATAVYERGEDGRLHIIFDGEMDAVSFMAPLTVSFSGSASGGGCDSAASPLV